MESSYLFLFLLCFQLLSGTKSIESAAECIHNYQELKMSILNNSENTENLLTSFYPPNRSPAHVLNVYYYTVIEQEDEVIVGNETHPTFEKPNITADHIFQWLDSSTLLLTEFRLFRALSFEIANLESGEVEIKVGQFCDPDREVELLNLATIWLKTFTAHDRDTEYYYSMYFNGEKFVVLGNSVRSSTAALIVCEYFASAGSLLVIYTILVLCRYELFAPMSGLVSDVSAPCLVFTLMILIKDIVSYSASFRYVSAEWNGAFPIPYVFPIFAIFNAVVSVIIAIVIGPNFRVPALIKVFYTNIGLKGKFYNFVVRVELIFSITSFAVLITFHFAWVVLAFAAYPVRSLASQAFTIPLFVTSLSLYFAINYIASSPMMVFQIKERSKRIALVIVSTLLTVPFLIALLGVLYYYSKVLIDVNDSQNFPYKTVIGGLVPTLITAVGAWAFRNALKAYSTAVRDDNKNEKENLNRDEGNRRGNAESFAPLVRDSDTLHAGTTELMQLGSSHGDSGDDDEQLLET